MSFQTPITIAEALESINTRRYLLPAIQREFVWDTEQIESLFDSILSGYPIGSFLLWTVNDESRRNYEFYEFIRDYHELRLRHNPRADATGPQEITAVLDGQQRLTALYIGLRGSYASKIKWRRRTSENAFPERRLYLNLLRRSQEFGHNYEFAFLTDAEASAVDGAAKHWFRVGEVLEFGSPAQVNRYLVQHQLGNNELPGEMLFNLHDAIKKTLAINYYLEKDQDFDKVLNIFIRVNSGGTPLSYSDLLLSVATAQWKSRDARETINELVDELNQQGRFRFDKDFVLKACLVLIDLADVRFRVTNFTVDNTGKIEERWPDISKALRLTVNLASSFGYTGQTLTSAYALLPVAYYLLRKGLPESFVESGNFAADRTAIRKWLVSATLAGAFGGQPDTVLNAARSTIGDAPGGFPGEALAARFAQLNRPLNLTDEQIDGLLDTKYGEGRAFGVLSTLYPTLDYTNLFHQDHIFPRSLFTRTKLRALGIAEEDVEFCLDNVDRLPNIQLLAGLPNQEKASKPPDHWMDERYPSAQERRAYGETNLIPPEIPPIFPDFRRFFSERRKLMQAKLSIALGRETGPGLAAASAFPG